MGCCRGICQALLILWTVIAMIYSIGMIGFMAFKLNGLFKQAKNRFFYHNLLIFLKGSGWYSNINIIQLNKYTWYASLGLAALMFIAAIIHIISTCKKSRCLLGLSSLLLVLALTADTLGLVFKFQAQDSIVERLTSSLNDTIINRYGEMDNKKLTAAWNMLGEKNHCCGINNAQDFFHAHYWKGDLRESKPPCGESVTKGCAKGLKKHFIIIDEIWFTTLIAVKIALMFLMLLLTFCVCKMGFKKDSEGSRDTDSYTLVRR